MTFGRSGEIIIDDACILNLFRNFSFRKHFDTVLTEEIRKAKSSHEVLVMPKHFMTKLSNILESSSYMSPLRAIIKSYQYF